MWWEVLAAAAGAAITGTGVLVWRGVSGRVGMPRRMSRVEGILTVLLGSQQAQSDALLVMLDCQHAEGANGRLEEAKTGIVESRKAVRDYINGAAVSPGGHA